MRWVGTVGLWLVWVLATLCFVGCAGRRTGPYRLVGEPGNVLLVPPGIRDPSMAASSFTVRKPRGDADCRVEEPGLRVAEKGSGLRISMRRETLAARTPGWLSR